MYGQNWKNQARRHWKEFQPSRYRELVKTGRLESALDEAVDLTFNDLNALEDVGVPAPEAWQQVRERYLFPPEEGAAEAPLNSPGLALMREALELNNRVLHQLNQINDEAL